MMRRRVAAALLAAASAGVVLAQPPERRAESPAASPVPETVTEQSYTAELIEQGRGLFGAQCGFCHGLDTAGGSGGADLTRSELVAADFMGDRIGAVVRAGRPNAQVPMPAFPAISAADLAGLVAYIHEQKSRAETVEGGRRAVSVDDVLSGNSGAGARYFAANCADCHSATGDLSGIGSRQNGLGLLQNMLYPRSGGPTPTVTVTTADGERFRGVLSYQDEFTIALTESDGRYRSFATRLVEFEVENPLDGHVALLGRLTDREMHDVLAYLHTLQ
jgi:cytochrome c oxidase cbb3-type subunit 3